jgi:hypothetical protein
MSTPTTISTRSRTIDLATFSSMDVDISDIARSLSHLCRFTGHVDRFYSVAEHSVRCSALVPQADALEALLHDAHEAYIGDISTPMKRWLPEIARGEALVESAVRIAFQLPPAMSDSVRRADRHLLILEAQHLLGATLGEVESTFLPYQVDGMGWSSRFAYDTFVARFHALIEQRQERAA